VIFVDSIIPMYLVGADHPHKLDARRWLERAISNRERRVSDAEVLQEILRRYVAIGRRDAIQPAFEALLGVVEEVFPIGETTVLRARTMRLGSPQLSARDAIHLAVMEQQGIDTILTFDRGFDRIPDIRRLGE
jgi:uncharacterized protein